MAHVYGLAVNGVHCSLYGMTLEDEQFVGTVLPSALLSVFPLTIAQKTARL